MIYLFFGVYYLYIPISNRQGVLRRMACPMAERSRKRKPTRGHLERGVGEPTPPPLRRPPKARSDRTTTSSYRSTRTQRLASPYRRPRYQPFLPLRGPETDHTTSCRVLPKPNPGAGNPSPKNGFDSTEDASEREGVSKGGSKMAARYKDNGAPPSGSRD